jgi:2-keto-3-deoxy-6-phosphogluconate aldolase
VEGWGGLRQSLPLPVGGEKYSKALKGPLRLVPLIAAGGINQMAAANFILAGASNIGSKNGELARRFVGL